MQWTRTAAGIVGVLAAVGLVVSVAAAWPRPDPVPSARAVEPGPPAVAGREAGAPPDAEVPARSSPEKPAAPARAVPTSRPIRVSVGSIDLTAPVRPVGVAPSGQMELPPDPRVLGWYRFGPVPSERGSTVVAGHLDSLTYGLGPLVGLRDVEVGDRVEVRTADRSVTTYAVTRIDRYDRQRLPARVFARTGPPTLRIITCGGDYDPRAGGYRQNLVVSARPA